MIQRLVAGTLLFALLVLLAPTGAQGICNLPPPVRPPKGMVPDGGGDRTPTDPSAPPETTSPGEPNDGPATPPGGLEDGGAAAGPKAPPAGPPGGAGGLGGPAAGPAGSPGSASSPRPRGADYSSTWGIWWELNREHILGLRKTLDLLEPASGSDRTPVDLRDEVRKSLREAALSSRDEGLMGTCLRALGRVGTDEDAALLLKILVEGHKSDEVVSSAAVGLASLEKIGDESVKEGIRAIFPKLLSGQGPKADRARLVAIMALSLRAGEDPSIIRELGATLGRQVRDADEAAAMMFAGGLSRDSILGAQILEAATSGSLQKRDLHDVARSHAALAVAMAGTDGGEVGLASILLDKKAREHTRRSAALALGMLLRDGRIPEETRRGVERSVLAAFEQDHDPIARGYMLLAMGQARPPFGVDLLVKTVDKTGDPSIKPYAALALGLAARGLEGREAAAVRRFLTQQVDRIRDVQLGAALCVAVGLADAVEAKAILLERGSNLRLDPGVRGPAIEGLGLLGDASGTVEKLLVSALDEENPEVVQDACIALGFIGRASTARLLVEKLRTTKSDMVRVHMVVALSHLGGTVTIRPLLGILNDKNVDESIRESAAAALGILADPREVDPMFEIDAKCNPFGLTEATRELVRFY